MKNIKLPEHDPRNAPRVCSTCNTEKPSSEFYLEKDKRAQNGIAQRSTCKPCTEDRKYKRFIEKTYNFTFDQYEDLFDKQGGKCAICESRIGNNRTGRLFVDHCHETHKVRGLLCSSCNHGLGQFKDSPKLLQKAISYLTDNK